ncbi:lipid-transfer protein [Amycolatopsis sp. OK19-0408]|uniref:propanoyl-CoA C-acyltransferase n=1 Tax=Amycolatopsis iheyensis TaxID=2945988 RepID=A0A9X2SK25_9PSEU|nr:lipid-transfer protein [Amycolatopsis iheyensis]MCR6485034.1 lipid-transfer protein [Amycolatopsis iheyensis]
MADVVVAGVGMVPFAKPRESRSYVDMAEGAVRAALEDAGLDYRAVGQAYAGYVYGDSTSGQAALYGVGLSGIPIVNVNNNCSTGSSALFLARQAVAAGVVDCALALGFEQMTPGALSSVYTDRVSPLARHDDVQRELRGHDENAPQAARLFGGAGQAYVDEFGIDPAVFARISVKARRHAANNPYAVFRDPITLDDVLNSPVVHGPLTRLQCCPPTCGAAAAIVCTPEFARAHGIDAGVRIKAQSLVTDTPATFEAGDMRQVVGYDMTVKAANDVYEAAGVGPEDLRVVELHDCFTTNEFLTYEALGLTPAGTAEKFVLDGDNTYGGRVVTNPSGGLLSKGHPLGATGLAQCAELVWQLRGQARGRQVDDVTVALQHNLGLGGACVVTLYEKAA